MTPLLASMRSRGLRTQINKKRVSHFACSVSIFKLPDLEPKDPEFAVRFVSEDAAPPAQQALVGWLTRQDIEALRDACISALEQSK